MLKNSSSEVEIQGVRNAEKKALFPFGIIGVLAMLLVGCIQQFFYYPDNMDHGRPDPKQIPYEKVGFSSRDGTRLAGWFFPTRVHADQDGQREKAKATVIHMHGNAQNMSAHWPFIAWLPERGFNVFMFDYRGFGDSEGSPDARGVFEDSLGAIEYVRGRSDVDPHRLVVFGQSLGGNNAIAAVGEFARNARSKGKDSGIRAVVAEAAFFSYSSIAEDKFSSAGYLVSDQYSASNYIADIAPIPLLLIHGDADPVVPDKHSRRLYESAGEPKTLLIVPGCGHIEALVDQRFAAGYRNIMVDFFERALIDITTSR